MQETLEKIGLTRHQAQAYLLLLDYGSLPPADVSKRLQLTRTNAYKLLDRLVELGLVSKSIVGKRLVYSPQDPISLTSILAEERNRVLSLEGSLKRALVGLRKSYHNQTLASEISKVSGKEAVKSLYEQQAGLKEPIYFIKTRADIPYMGYETMDVIRKLVKPYGTKRFGIIPDAPEASPNTRAAKEANLTKTWINNEDYTAPVEWTVCNDELTILIYAHEPMGIKIKNAIVADAFKQVWKALDKNLRANPAYKKMPKKAKRTD